MATSSKILTSPQSRRSTAPWTQIVRGDSDPINSSVAPSSPSSYSSDWSPSKSGPSGGSAFHEDGAVDAQTEDGNAGKKPAWSKPYGGVEASPVMGAESWPALYESTRASPKSVTTTAPDSPKPIFEGSISLSQGSGIALSPHKQVNNANPTSTPNYLGPTRQRSMKRGTGSSNSNVSANGGFPQAPPPQGSVVEVPPNNFGKSSSDHVQKETGQKGSFGSQSHSGNDHQQQQRNSFRRGNGGLHQRGDGSYHHGYGGRRDQDRGNQDWNTQRSFNGRDTHLQSQRGSPRGFLRIPPHTTTPFIPPPPSVRPFGNPMLYPDMASPVIYVAPPPEAFRGMPIVPPMSPVYFPVPDLQLHTKIVNQIEYYFSNENLIKDTFLRQNMDDQGWVPIKLIAGFKKVLHLTDNIHLILDVLQTSTLVEVQGDKVRKRNGWMRWLMPPAVQFSPVSSPQSVGRSNYDTLAVHLQSVRLDERNANHNQNELFLSRSSSGELSNQSQQSGGEVTSQVTVQAGFERTAPAGISSN